MTGNMGETHRFTTRIGNDEIIIETGKLAEQAGGAVTVQLGQTMVFATATMSKHAREGIDYFPLSVGEPIVAERVQGAEAALALKLPEEGYPFATIGQRDILLDGATGGGDYTLPVDIGPRARFGGFETTGDLAFDADHVETLSRFKRGDLYDSRMVDDLRHHHSSSHVGALEMLLRGRGEEGVTLLLGRIAREQAYA